MKIIVPTVATVSIIGTTDIFLIILFGILVIKLLVILFKVINMSIRETIKEALNKTHVRGILALSFGAAVIYGFVAGMISEQNIIDLVTMIFIFFFVQEAVKNH